MSSDLQPGQRHSSDTARQGPVSQYTVRLLAPVRDSEKRFAGLYAGRRSCCNVLESAPWGEEVRDVARRFTIHVVRKRYGRMVWGLVAVGGEEHENKKMRVEGGDVWC
ncbi:hypothetical protein ElyMa_001899800 [Elysia marginata]|uniref:Uncharacterized protein n=1 Tax=Elysia marginata TaxID=1093978 RepID=A0AAV4ERG5_9GAST|nr:hypothetical protein ElyMa_001899800 [Elysia marginata]